MIGYPMGEDREPEVAIGHVVVGLLREHVAEPMFLLIARGGKDPFDLSEQSSTQSIISAEWSYRFITLVDRQPLLTDEMLAFHRVQVSNDDVFQKPRGG
jgi:hypothetical protein